MTRTFISCHRTLSGSRSGQSIHSLFNFYFYIMSISTGWYFSCLIERGFVFVSQNLMPKTKLIKWTCLYCTSTIYIYMSKLERSRRKQLYTTRSRLVTHSMLKNLTPHIASVYPSRHLLHKNLSNSL